MRLWIAAFVVGACGNADSQSESGVPTPLVSSASYWLTWAGGDVTEEATGWSVENDLGYRIHVTAGGLQNLRVQLVPCEEESSAASTLNLLAPFFGGAAWAGHGDAVDPSHSHETLVEQLDAPSAQVWDEVSFTPAVYCQLHFILSGTEEEPRSLWVSGTVEYPDGEEEALSIETTLSWGENLFLSEMVAIPEEEPVGLRVLLERDQDSLFDGLDFASEKDVLERSKILLRNLVQNSRVRLDLL
jgi:hypothetical protein